MCSSSNFRSSERCWAPMPSLLWWLSLFTCLLASFRQCDAFNVDIEHVVRFRGNRGSMFGFTVAEHRDRLGNWVLVGAPTADTAQYQPGVTRGGAVYRCDVRADDYCQQLPFDRNGNMRNSSGFDKDRKSHQWLGATLQTSSDGSIVACAPRYVHLPWTSQGPHVDPVGTCFVARDEFQRITEYAPCRSAIPGHHQQGSCQAGFSACLSKNGDRLFIGAPGSWYWQGQVYSQDLNDRSNSVWTAEGPVQLDNSYLGYSMTAGDFTGDGTSGTAVGRPRGGDLRGEVILYTETLEIVGEFIGEQLGAYFGYAICVADMDGDKIDDLIIGAPLYTVPNNEGKYEIGRIYVIYQGTERKFATNHWRDGVNSKSRFGFSLASIGDINKDGYGDIAVGAPYDGPRGGGAVYIYHGSAAGIRKEASQVLIGESIYNGISTFGFSVAGGVDLDNNQYPDIAVGAYDADVAMFFKSRPVILMDATIMLGPDSKVISLEEKNCTLRDGTETTCTTVKMCFKYSGIGVDPKHEFEIQLILDAKKMKSPRMFFHRSEGIHTKNFTLSLNNNLEYCRSHLVYIRPGVRDKLSPLEAVIKYDTKYSRERVQRSLTPVLDQRKPLLEHDTINIQKNCGADNVCIPDLVLETNPTVARYFLGSGEKLEIEVKVINLGEDAFESTYNLKIPPGLHYSKIDRLDENEQEIPVLCSAPSMENNNTLKCDIGNPLPRNKRLHYKVVLEPFYKENLKAQYEFVTEVNSTNPENSSSIQDNVKHFSVPISIETDISVTGISSPQELYYNATAYNTINVTRESEIGPQLIHSYTITNNGPSDIVEAEVYVLWPMYTLAGDPFFYVLEQPDVSGPIVCDKLEGANPLNLKIEQRRKGLDAAFSPSYQGKTETGASTGSKTTTKVTTDGRTTITQTHSETYGGSTYHKSTGEGVRQDEETRIRGTVNGISENAQSTGESSSTISGVGGATYNEQFEKNSTDSGDSYNITYYYGPGKETGTVTSVYSSQNYTVTWVDGKPVRHYSNYSFSTSEDSERAFRQGIPTATGPVSNGSSGMHHHTTSSQENGSTRVVVNQGKLQPVALQGGGIRFVPAHGFGGSEATSTLHVEENLFPGAVTSDGQLKHYWIYGNQNTASESGGHRTLNDISGSQAQGSSTLTNMAGNSQGEMSQFASSSEDHGSGVQKYHTQQQWHSSQSYPGVSKQSQYHDEETEYEEYYEEEEETYEQSGTHNSEGVANFNHNEEDVKKQKFQLYDRFIREASNYDDFSELIQCNSTKCIRLRCVVEKFTKDQEINIQIRSRAWAQTLRKVVSNKQLRISSLLAMQVTKLPYIGKPYRPVIQSEEVFTDAIATDVPIKPDIVPLWVVVLSACAGVLILLLLVLILWKCGFFKRNRPSDAAEKEPLNRNGAY